MMMQREHPQHKRNPIAHVYKYSIKLPSLLAVRYTSLTKEAERAQLRFAVCFVNFMSFPAFERVRGVCSAPA